MEQGSAAGGSELIDEIIFHGDPVEAIAKTGSLLRVELIAFELMSRRAAFVDHPRLAERVKVGARGEANQWFAKWSHLPVHLASPDTAGVGKVTLPEHSQSHLLGIERQVDALRVAHANSSFSDPRIAASEHDRFVAGQ